MPGPAPFFSHDNSFGRVSLDTPLVPLGLNPGEYTILWLTGHAFKEPFGNPQSRPLPPIVRHRIDQFHHHLPYFLIAV